MVKSISVVAFMFCNFVSSILLFCFCFYISVIFATFQLSSCCWFFFKNLILNNRLNAYFVWLSNWHNSSINVTASGLTMWTSLPESRVVFGLCIIKSRVDFSHSFRENLHDWQTYFNDLAPHEAELPSPWNTRLNEFQKMIILRCLRPDKVLTSTFCLTINCSHMLLGRIFQLKKSRRSSLCRWQLYAHRLLYKNYSNSLNGWVKSTRAIFALISLLSYILLTGLASQCL